jgi:uncharacterized ion transporter superfamily protein YfcC
MSVSQPEQRRRRRIRVPHVYSIIFVLIVLTALVSLVVPAGSYERDDEGRVVPETFRLDRERAADEAPPPARPDGFELLFAVLQAPLRGIVDAANIIAFLIVIGGAFKVIDLSGAFEAAIHATVRAMRGREFLIIPATMTVFSAGGAVFGMSEEVIPFVLLLVPLMGALGYPPVIGVAVPLVGAGMGFAGAMLNPFTVGVAQAIAGLPPVSGWPLRTVVWVILTAFGITYVALKARRLREPPAADPDVEEAPAHHQRLTLRHALVLAALALGIVVMVWGIHRFEWFVIEIGAIFFAIGLVAGLVARLSPNAMANAFLDGAKDLLSAAIVVGIARGIVLLARDVGLLDPALFAMASALEPLPGAVSLNAMFLFQSVLNFLVPSGSGQAALTMPIMAPLAELAGLTRQMAVLAFQFGDGFSNLIIPTSAVLMGSLESGRVSYERWFAFAWPLQLWLFGLGAVILTIAVAIGYGAA